MIKVTIFGVGLIGGSLALCFKGKPDIQVAGHSNNLKSIENMLRRNVVDIATSSMREAAADADFIFLCVPVSQLEAYLTELAQLPLKPGCIITDVGSTKASISECAAKLELTDVHFIGGHPMAGSERSGVDAAMIDLFENAFYVLTPGEGTPQSAIDRLTELLVSTKAQIVQVDAKQHDDIVGAISHLPHIIAVALVNQICSYNEQNPLYKNLAAGGFRDLTRIASSDPKIWRDILLNNKHVLLTLLKDWNSEIERFTSLLEREDGDGIEAQFLRANQFRKGVPERKVGMLSPQFDLYVDIPDHPGMIAQVATLLSTHKINLRNIHISESRLEIPGVLRLSFGTQNDADRAVELLSSRYSVHI